EAQRPVGRKVNMDFSRDTYIVLNLPGTVADEVLAIRKQLDFFFESIPAEITLTGSSGALTTG
ncbi:MAG: hypothetical protein V2A79_11145, partial [Planctomycetota bacterium]